MNYDIDIYDGLQPSAEIGYIHKVIPKVSQNNQHYAHILVNIPNRRDNEKVYNIVKFYFAPAIWKRYKPYINVNELWLLYFKLTGNEKGGIHYCNASVTSALKIKPSHKPVGQGQQNKSDKTPNKLDQMDHYETEFN